MIQNIIFVLLGATNFEQKLATKVENTVQKSESITNLCGKSTVEELPIILNDLDLILTNDTGTMHLSIAMGKDTVSIFGPTNPDEFGPYQDLDKHKVLSVDNCAFVKDRYQDYKIMNKTPWYVLHVYAKCMNKNVMFIVFLLDKYEQPLCLL